MKKEIILIFILTVFVCVLGFAGEMPKPVKTKTMKSKMKWIASLKIWVVIYPSITFFLYFFGESLAVLPLYQRTFLLTITLVPWIVFARVPFVDTVVRRILVRNRNYKH